MFFLLINQYNFVGRLLGPRGLTAKQMEQDLGCKIMVRGKGSMRDKRKVILSTSFYEIQKRTKICGVKRLTKFQVY